MIGCGSSDTTPPTFTSAQALSVAENQTSAITLQATDTESSVTYSISGTDSGSFNVDGTSGVVSFKVAPDYETKTSYVFTATATDSSDNNVTQDVTVNITDVYEPTAYVKKTGQTKSYNTGGTEITDSSLKDDGYYQTGETPRYTRASDMVSDELTGLMWQDDATAASTTKQWLTTDNYNTCANDTTSSACYDTSGDTAASYCSDLVLGGYSDWRLPTSTELEGILDYGKVNPAIDTAYFNNVSSDYYWSSTTYEDYKDYAWVVYFYDGYVYYNGKDNNRYVRCVRAGQ